jgi:hypothetical protein
MVVNHGLTESQVNSLISTDNSNRNIYRRKLSVTNFPINDEKLAKILRDDFKNIRFVIKDQKVLLNHSVDSEGSFILEIPNRYLKADTNVINVIFMPIDYEYDNYAVDLSLTTLTTLDDITYNELEVNDD